MITIVAGSRSIVDYDLVKKCIEESGVGITELVSGCAVGVDKLGIRWALENQVPVKKFPVTDEDWKVFGKRAGILRNEKMGHYSEALVAVWDGKSSGTKHMIDFAIRLGLLVRVFTVGDDAV
ncbi:MAG: SLOG family protein [Candidatus Paceibacterota bacterium]